MDLVSTPQPHFIPGYTGHCPQYNYRIGKTYASLTHKLLIDPCVRHSPKILIACSDGVETATDKPTLKEVDLIKTSERQSDAVLKYPIIPGYDGFIPNLHRKIGDRFLAAATAGVAEHVQYMQRYKCEQRLIQRGLIKKTEIKTMKQEKDLECKTPKETHEDTKIPYSKHTPPHFMADEDPQKYIKKGYDGHVPMAFKRIGEPNKELTANALREFSCDYNGRLHPQLQQIAEDKMNARSFKIYHRTTGMIPNYTGHVPGEMFKFGKTYGKNTINAKKELTRAK